MRESGERWIGSQGSMPATSQQVLIVEDDNEIRATLAFLLRDAGYTVHEASDGKPALERLRRSRERLVVLLDLRMPGVDGVQVMHAVAADDNLATRHAYIVMTANERTFPLEFAALLSRLKVPVIAKPFDIEALLDAVDQAAARLES